MKVSIILYQFYKNGFRTMVDGTKLTKPNSIDQHENTYS